jgi:hypothetical protein
VRSKDERQPDVEQVGCLEMVSKFGLEYLLSDGAVGPMVPANRKQCQSAGKVF